MLDLVLEKNARFKHATLGNCKAAIEFSPEQKSPSASPAVTATGVFSLVNSGNAVDAVITARGDLHRDATTEPKDIKVTLTADATITVSFAEGETEVDTGIVWENGEGGADTEPTTVKPEGMKAVVKQDGAQHPHTLRLTRTDGSKAARIDVTFPGVEVATGCGRDENFNGPLTIKGVGEAHVDALCNWEKASGLKSNPTHLRIRTVNPHEKIYTIGVEKAPVVPGVGG